jgi:hypothetical protein
MANLAVLCALWMFFFLLGGVIGLNIAFILLLAATILHLIGK